MEKDRGEDGEKDGLPVLNPLDKSQRWCKPTHWETAESERTLLSGIITMKVLMSPNYAIWWREERLKSGSGDKLTVKGDKLWVRLKWTVGNGYTHFSVVLVSLIRMCLYDFSYWVHNSCCWFFTYVSLLFTKSEAPMPIIVTHYIIISSPAGISETYYKIHRYT